MKQGEITEGGGSVEGKGAEEGKEAKGKARRLEQNKQSALLFVSLLLLMRLIDIMEDNGHVDDR